MESFEHVCKVALEAEGFVVTTNVKFPVRRQTRRADRDEFQTYGCALRMDRRSTHGLPLPPDLKAP
jgi:hypothetical protein